MNGFVVLDKEKDITSFSAVGKVKRLLGEYGEKKAGHTGTLDPMATGVLVVALGRATSFIDLLDKNARKKYRASFILGCVTDTLDITGKVLEKKDVLCSTTDVERAIYSFLGESMQLPPMYSAIKKDGRKLYELARKGIEVEREQRKITIFDISDFSQNDGEYSFTVECSKGTYIRSLISDIGQKLGCGACMTSLRRLSSDNFDISQAHTFSEIDSEENKEKLFVSVESVFETFDDVFLTSGKARRFQNGGALGERDETKNDLNGKMVRVYDDEKSFLGIGEYVDGILTVKKLYKLP